MDPIFFRFFGIFQEWSGPRQLLDASNFKSIDDLKVIFDFNFLKSPTVEAMKAEWKIKITKSEEIKYYLIFSQNFENNNWESVHEFITLPNFIIESDAVEIYMSVTPKTSDYRQVHNTYIRYILNACRGKFNLIKNI